jgi:hypothetical protein
MQGNSVAQCKTDALGKTGQKREARQGRYARQGRKEVGGMAWQMREAKSGQIRDSM